MEIIGTTSSIKRIIISTITVLIVFLPQLLPGAILEEIVVTAQKREQDIQDVSISITAFSGEQIKALGFEQSTDVARMSPGVYLSGDTGGQKSNFTIRGVGQNDPLDTAESPVAVYVDEGYVAALNGQIFGLWDIQRVEIAKGPQGTLFGRNATGGLVHFITAKPTNEFEAFADLSYASYDQLRVEGAVSGPLTDSLKGRVSGFYNRHDAVYENIFPDQALNVGGAISGGGQDTGDDDTWGLRGHFQFNPNDDMEILLSGYGSRTEISTAQFEQEPHISVMDAQGRVVGGQHVSPTETREAIGPGGVNADVDGFFGPVPRPVPGGDFFGFTDPEGPNTEDQDFVISQDFAYKDINEFESLGGSAKITWDLDNITLTSITDYKKFEKKTFLDSDASATDFLNVAFTVDSESIAQEIRLNGEADNSRWVAGLYYLHVNNITQAAFLIEPNSILVGFESDIVSAPDVKTDSYSAFGQVEYDFTGTLTLVAGLRVVREEKELRWDQGLYLNENNLSIDTNVPFVIFAPTLNTDNNETLWTGKLQFDWRPNDDLLLYAGVNRGVKSGGFNHPITFGGFTAFDEIPYEEEVLLSYEAGFKATLFDGNTRFNGSFYYYDYEDFQATRWALFTNFIVNNDATNYGVDLELISNPAPGWDLMLTLGYLDAEVDNVEIADGIFRDVEPTYSPELTLSGLVRYELPNEVFTGKVSAQLDYNYVSSFYSNLRNFDSQREDSYIIGNARVSWSSADERWNVSFFVKNLADNRYVTINFDNAEFCGCSQSIYGNPRWFGGNVRYNWR